MNPEKREKYKNILEKKKDEAKNTLEKMRKNETAKKSGYSPVELSNYDNHPAEIGSDLYQEELNNALKVRQSNDVDELEAALTRIEDGTYGRCEFCGGEIDEDRLDVLPQAMTCIRCKEEKMPEHGDVMKTRPVEEKVMDAYFGRKYLNRREDDENEGLDYLNDLMKYGSADSPQDLGGYRDYKNYYNNEQDEQGIVDSMDKISNEEYKKQLP
jgi:RNA polymerase-binding transcription factor DksA